MLQCLSPRGSHPSGIFSTSNHQQHRKFQESVITVRVTSEIPLECLRQAITSEDDATGCNTACRRFRVIPTPLRCWNPFGDIVDQFPRVLKMMLVLDEEDTTERSSIIIDEDFDFPV